MTERVQKVLARAGVGSRRQVEDWIKQGRLTVNGRNASLGTKVQAGDKIALDGRPVRIREPTAEGIAIYHRPSSGPRLASGVAASAVIPQLPGARRRWISVSPLPASDSGLEVFTTDGDLAHALLRRFSTIRFEFALRVTGDPRLEQLQRIKSGVIADGETLNVESLELEGGEGVNRWFKLTVYGAGARDIHRLCTAAGLQLSRLMRVSFGPLAMDRSLSRGRVRVLDGAEAAAVYLLAELPARPSSGEPDRARSKRRSAAPARKPKGTKTSKLRHGKRRASRAGHRNSDR